MRVPIQPDVVWMNEPRMNDQLTHGVPGKGSRLEQRLGHSTLWSMFLNTVYDRRTHVAVRSHDDRLSFSYSELLAEAESLSAGLAGIGVRRGDAVALMLTNRPEFFPADLAALALGAVPFSLYNSSAASQLVDIFDDAQSRVVICERRFVDVILEACRLGASIDHMIVVDGDGSNGTLTLDQLKGKGRPGFDMLAEGATLTPDDVVTLIYTSGSTGLSKGVELSHANLVAEVRAINAMVPQTEDGSHVSYLPAAHIGDRMRAYYGSILAYGHELTTVADAKDLNVAMKRARPTYCGGPPRIWEKHREAIEAKFGGDVAERALRDSSIGEEIRTDLGLDRALWVVTGSAPTAAGQFEFFDKLGINLCELWGMSEMCAIATTNTPQARRIGSVGRAVPSLTLEVASDGELLARGPTLTRRYRNRPEATAEAFDDDGWFHTGDIAKSDDDGFWWIIDRKKEIMINAAGKNMSPANIESKLKAASPLIMQACVIGDRRPFNVALIVANAAVLEASGFDKAAAAQQLLGPINDANGQLSRVEQIKRYAVFFDEWLPGSDVMTDTMKLKRASIENRFADTIEALYSNDADSKDNVHSV
jgi:long-chain acyl-CoA synthetase